MITIIYNDINSSCKRDYTGYNNYNGYTNYKDYNDHNTYWGNNNFVVTLFTMIMKITSNNDYNWNMNYIDYFTCSDYKLQWLHW